MEITEENIKLAFATSDFYQLLSLSMHFPTAELTAAMIDGSYRDDVLSILEDLSSTKEDIQRVAESFDELVETRETSEQLLKQMCQEYTRLFNDPIQPLLNIYESLFLHQSEDTINKPMLFMNSTATDIEHCYKAAGIRLNSKNGEPTDHMATELEFMMYLFANKGKAMNEQDQEGLEKVEKHILTFQVRHFEKWGYEFFNRLEDSAELEPYRVIARMAKIGLTKVLNVKEVELS